MPNYAAASAGTSNEEYYNSDGLELVQRQAEQVDRIYCTVTDSAILHDALENDIVASRRAVLRYYTAVFASMLSTNHENNCFLSGKRTKLYGNYFIFDTVADVQTHD